MKTHEDYLATCPAEACVRLEAIRAEAERRDSGGYPGAGRHVSARSAASRAFSF